MKCSQFRDWLNESLTVQGVKLTEAVGRHIDSCPDCGRYYHELQDLQAKLAPLEQIELTVAEQAKISGKLATSLSASALPQMEAPVRNLSGMFLRPILALAAVLAIAFGSWQNQTHISAIKPAVDEMELAGISGQELATIFVNGEIEEISTAIDQTSISYLANQISSRQAEDILEEVTDDEIDWLIDNLDMEI